MASHSQNPMAKESQLHIAMVPWLAYGHLIPFLELSKFLARKGHKISFISTPKNIDRLQIPSELSSSITFVKLPLPHVDGLPENAEGTMEIHPDDVVFLKIAFDGMETEVTRFLEDSAPDVVIYDFAPYWVAEAAAKLGIYRVFFCVFNAWFLGFMGPSTDAMINLPGPRTKLEDFLMPPSWVPFETKVAYKRYEVMRIFRSVQKNTVKTVNELYRLGKGIEGCDAIVIRHCYEFEGDWLKLLEELHHKPVVPLGLMPPAVDTSSGDETWASINGWLDGQKSRSVLYVALGTEFSLSQQELSELALGLELSGVPFFWTLKKPAALSESGTAELPEGFEERVKDRGIIWKSWAPQSKILSHDSVGGFLTHCGWNSTIEGLMQGRPLVMLPFLVDQGMNARVLEDRQLGIEIPRSEWDGTFTKDSVAESVKLVMVEDGGRKYRDTAKEVGSIFGDRELHDSYTEKFIESLETNASKNKQSESHVL